MTVMESQGTPKYSRWVDNKGRMFVFISLYWKIIDEKPVPQNYELLEVNAEKMHVHTYDTIQELIKTKKLKRL